MNEGQAGTLYLVGTPIGNLEDLSPRAARVLSQVDFIAAEDTRVSLKLLAHLGVKKPLVSYHEHNRRQRGEEIVSRLLRGESCAVVTDAGMPCISDPGEELVAQAARAGLRVEPVPGPSAAIAALAVSGLPTARFAFEGFLTVNRAGRRQRLQQLAGEERTLLFYEAPHKLLATLQDLCAAFGPERRVALCRELTKRYEEVQRTTLGQAACLFEGAAPRGEFVLVVEGAPPPQAPPATLEQAAALAAQLARGGMPASAAARQAAQQTGLKKSEIYRALQQGGAPEEG